MKEPTRKLGEKKLQKFEYKVNSHYRQSLLESRKTDRDSIEIVLTEGFQRTEMTSNEALR